MNLSVIEPVIDDRAYNAIDRPQQLLSCRPYWKTWSVIPGADLSASRRSSFFPVSDFARAYSRMNGKQSK